MKFSALTWLGFGLAIVCFAWFLGTADYNDLSKVFSEVNLMYLPLLLGVNLLINVGRALRWKVILQPLGGISLRESFKYTTIGFGANILLPARAGEFIKPYLLSRDLDVPFSTVFTTVILERILDLIVLMTLLATTVAVLPWLLKGNTELEAVVGYVSSFFSLITVGSLVTCVYTAWYPDSFRKCIRTFDKILPSLVSDKIDRLTDSFVDGVHVLKSPWVFLQILGISFGFWMINLVFYWLAGMTAGFDMGITGAVIAMTVSAFAAALPQAPGFIGPFHVAMETALKAVGNRYSNMQRPVQLSHGHLLRYQFASHWFCVFVRNGDFSFNDCRKRAGSSERLEFGILLLTGLPTGRMIDLRIVLLPGDGIGRDVTAEV